MQKDFSYSLNVDDLASGESTYKLNAGKDELEFLRNLLKVEEVHSFEALLKIKLDRKKYILTVKGNVKAKIELKSVISLENFTKTYNNDFVVFYNTKPVNDHKDEEEYDFDDEVIEDIVDGKLDLVNVAAEQLALLIDDYPKKDGETFNFKSEFSEEDKKNPFDVLAKLKK